MSLLQLPAECILTIMTRLPVQDVVSMASCCTALKQLAQDDGFWGDLAEAKWGTSARALKPLSEQQQKDAASAGEDGAAAAPGGSWQRYCYKRMSARTIRRSPLNLLQESYPDPWQHIICCVLCSRTSGSEVIRGAIAAFFAALPTPTAVLAASDGLLQDLLHPLGLQASRMAAVKCVSHNFLATDWETPAEFHGCGKFVEDSWRIFCRGWRDTRQVADANLKAYLAWVNRQPHCSSQPATAGARAHKQRTLHKQAGHNKQQQQEQGSSKGGRRTSARRQQQQEEEPVAQGVTAQQAPVRTRSSTRQTAAGRRCSGPKAGAASQRAAVSGRSKATGSSKASNRSEGVGLKGQQCGKRQRRHASTGQLQGAGV